jgi:DNA-binding winged helix-turn-helix (wHTH) protein/TolB-like protein/Tfp pilus assembly protein PilF
MSLQTKYFYEFGPFRLNPEQHLLTRNGEAVSLTPKALETLLVLVENSGYLVEKGFLMKRVWPDAYVEEGNLTLNISTLRKALGETATYHQYIETIPKRGYRFVAPVRVSQDENIDLVLEEHTLSSIITEEGQEATPQEFSETLFERVLNLGRARKRRAGWQLHSLLTATLLIGLGVTISVFYFWLSGKPKATEEGSAMHSVAVLPFKLLGPAGDDEYLGVGMADALITRLGNIKQLVVRPTSSVLKYTASGQDPQAIGRELQVESVLDGKIQRVGDSIRITVQLVSARDGLPLWAGKFDEQFTNVLSLQDSISEQVAAALMVKLSGKEEQLLTRHDTEDSEAYQLYLKGRYHWNKRTGEGLLKGIDYFQRAVEQDPQYALAYAGLADSYNALPGYGLAPPVDSFPRAKEAAKSALQIDDTLAEAHTALAYATMSYDWNWPEAEREFKLAIELSPNYAFAHHWYALYLQAMQRQTEAIAEMKRAVELEPLSLTINSGMSWVFCWAGRYEEAIESALETLELDPDFLMAHVRLGEAYEQKLMLEEAIRQFQQAVTLTERRPRMLAQLAHAYVLAGKKSQAQLLLNEAKDRLKQRYDTPYFLALAYVVLGERDQAIHWLERCYEERANLLVHLNVDPALDRLRPDPRFQDLLGRIGLPH